MTIMTDKMLIKITLIITVTTVLVVDYNNDENVDNDDMRPVEPVA